MPSEKRLLRWILFVVSLAFLPIIFDLAIELFQHGTIDLIGVLRHTDILIVILVVAIEAASDVGGRRLEPGWDTIAITSFFVCIIISLLATLVFALIKISGATASGPSSHTSTDITTTPIGITPYPTLTPIAITVTHPQATDLTAQTQALTILFMVVIAFLASLCCKIAVGHETD